MGFETVKIISEGRTGIVSLPLKGIIQRTKRRADRYDGDRADYRDDIQKKELKNIQQNLIKL
jgi:hypothetical protein